MKFKSLLFVVLILFSVSNSTIAQQFQYFSNIAGGSTGTAGWDQFSPLNPGAYVGPHLADIVKTGLSSSTVSVTPGGFKAGTDLYAFFSSPTWMVSVNGAQTANPFTSIALQVAVTPPGNGPDLNNTSFLLNGQLADQFISLGQLTTLNAGGGQPPQPVNYYWAAWNGLLADDNFSFSIGPGGNHATFTAARVDYVNGTDPNFQISSVPEPSSLMLSLVPFLTFSFIRRRSVGFGR
jgi:hypothetical protein